MIQAKRFRGAFALGVVATTCLSATTVLAQQQAQSQCARDCLIGFAERYLEAMGQHDPSRAPFAPNVRFTENGSELRLPDGLWRTVSRVGPYRLYVADPLWQTIGFFSTHEENGSSLVLATRLKVVNGLIAEVETVVSRHSPNEPNGGLSGLPAALKGEPRRQFVDVVPPAQRLGRQRLIDIANSYWTALELNDGRDQVPFADDCYRLENGNPTTLVPVREGREPGSASMSCRDQFANGYYREDTRVRDRRFLAVDEERNLVYQTVFIEHDAAKNREYQLNDGRTQRVTRTAPWTWMPQVVIQINPAGQISQIEATPLSVPYGLNSGWSNYETRPSEVQDGPRPW